MSHTSCSTSAAMLLREVKQPLSDPECLLGINYDGYRCLSGFDGGRAEFDRLQDRAKRRRCVPGADQVTFVAFDLLLEHGHAMSDLSLLERKRGSTRC